MSSETNTNKTTKDQDTSVKLKSISDKVMQPQKKNDKAKTSVVVFKTGLYLKTGLKTTF